MAEQLRSHDGQKEKRERFTKDKLVEWLKGHYPDKVSCLFQEADHVRKVYMGDEVHIRGIIEFSNFCKKGCL